MVSSQKKVRALGLCSGGLDSILSALVLREQGIDVGWVSFETPFFSADKARKASEMTGIPLTVWNITAVYLKMLKNPHCGYGKYMNPCLDCHALMFRLAGRMMEEQGFDFLFSGEVMGQRPMSQTKSSLRYVEKNSGYEGRIVRPLSIQHLPETLAEQEGLVDRNRLYGFTGRSRKPQIALADHFGITDYPNPGGGCLLTDKHFSIRLKDLFTHQPEHPEKDLLLLKYGRHLRLDSETKLIVGRDQKENETLKQHYYSKKTDFYLKTCKVPGPIGLIPGGGDRNILKTAASICVSYSKAPLNEPVDIEIRTPGGNEVIQAEGMPSADYKSMII